MVDDTGGFAFGVVGQDTPLLLTGPQFSEPVFDQRHRERVKRYTYHYLFAQLTMGLALLIVIIKSLAMRSKRERYNQAARFWRESSR
jgi:Cytochrome bd terminal oxidase subunit I